MPALAGWLGTFITGTLASILVGILNSFGWRALILKTFIALTKAVEAKFKDSPSIVSILEGVASGLQDVLDGKKST